MEGKWIRLRGALAAIGLLVFIFDSNLALEGAQSGLELCIKTVIPALFPFFVLSMILSNTLTGHTAKPVQILAAFLQIPQTATSVLMPAILGGYPVGAKCVGDLYQRNQIRQSEAERLLAFCNNAGPSFLFGMVSGFFPEKKFVWLLWIIHICSAFLTAATMPAEKADSHVSLKEPKSESSILLSAAKAMCTVCCWVILFRTILSFLNTWIFWMLPIWAKVLLIGILELTNGCCELLLITDVNLRFILCSCLLAFGGICVLFQTASVTSGLRLTYYLKGKLIQTACSFLMSCAIIGNHRVFFSALLPIMIMILRKIQKRYSNPQILPV